MNCTVCESQMSDARRRTKKYCSPECAYRARADREGRRKYVPAAERGAAGATYFSVHARLRVALGPAADHDCFNCDRPAAEWAYDHSDPNELYDEKAGLAFSSDLNRYTPSCRRCHREFDNSVADRRARCGTRSGYDRHRRVTKTPPCQPCKDAIAAIQRRRQADITEYQEPA